MSAHPQPKMTPEEYLKAERATESKNEYFNGYVYARSGGSFAHVLIASNLVRTLGNMLREGCVAVSNDLRMRVSYSGLYTYPDVIVICGKPQFIDDQHDTLTNPTMLIEILSPSTEAYDRGFKSSQYRQIESLREYALVSQKEPRIEVYRRHQDGQWLLNEFAGLDALCRLVSIDGEVPLSAVHQNLTFEESAPR